MKRLLSLPNIITLANLMSGCLGIIFVLYYQAPKMGSLFIIVAIIFDFLDGFVARLMKVSSEIGKQLDSLADVVSFGVLPGMILFMMLDYSEPEYLRWFAFLIPAFSALRLAKFNIDTRQTYGFIGLPTPANALAIASFPVINDMYLHFWYNDILSNHWFLVAYIIVFSYLLVSEIPMKGLKFKTFGWKGNEFIFIFLGLCVVLLFFFRILAVPLIIYIYILYSIFLKVWNR